VPRSKYNNMCGGPPTTLNGAILGLAPIRNAVAHSNLVGLAAAEYLALVAKAKSYMHETPEGLRHGSVSGGLATLVLKPANIPDPALGPNAIVPASADVDFSGWGGDAGQSVGTDERQAEPLNDGW